MPIFEISNPSDAYTIEGPLKECCVAVVYIGRGKYGLTDENEKTVFPIVMLGGVQQLDAFCQENFGMTWEKTDASVTMIALADVLDTVLIGRIQERQGILDKINAEPEEKRKAMKDMIHDQRRSSMNNIGHIAWEYAKLLREKQHGS